MVSAWKLFQIFRCLGNRDGQISSNSHQAIFSSGFVEYGPIISQKHLEIEIFFIVYNDGDVTEHQVSHEAEFGNFVEKQSYFWLQVHPKIRTGKNTQKQRARIHLSLHWFLISIFLPRQSSIAFNTCIFFFL